MKNFADLLRETRTRAGLTRKELAGKVGVDPSYISRIERGIYDPPSREKVSALMDVLGITQQTQRVYFLLTAGCAAMEDLEGLEAEGSIEDIGEGDLLFGNYTLHFPQPRELEENDLIARIRELLRNPTLSPEEHTEYIRLLNSFIDWLEFRVRESRGPERES